MKNKKQIIKDFKSYCKYNGYAHIACWLDYRDCQAVKKWDQRGNISDKIILQVQEFLEINKGK